MNNKATVARRGGRCLWLVQLLFKLNFVNNVFIVTWLRNLNFIYLSQFSFNINLFQQGKKSQ